MPGITNPSEEFFKNGLWGWVTDQWKKLIGDDAGHLQVDVVESGLPAGAATSAKQDTLAGHVDGIEGLLAGGLPSVLATDSLKTTEQSPLTGFATSANQTTMITALQLIDDLRNALGSVDTDDLQVDIKTMPTATVQAGGGDKIFSFESVVEEEVSDINLAAGNVNLDGTAVASGKIWKLTHADFKFVSGSVSRVLFRVNGLANIMTLYDDKSPTSDQYYIWDGEIYMQAGDNVRLTLFDCTLGDDGLFRYCGVQMDAP